MMRRLAAMGGMRAWGVGLALVTTALLATALEPQGRASAQAATAMDLDAMVPVRFGEWRMAAADQIDPIQPELKAKVEAVYVRTLGRTYVNPRGDRIMLSIAYGSNQLSDHAQSHRPEYCYKAQGFEVFAVRNDALTTPGGMLPLRRLFASHPGRNEPISYWMTIGNRAILPGLGRKLAQLRHAMAGEVPDGLLVRVSSIDRDTEKAYEIHDRFIRDLLLVIAEPGRFGLQSVAKTVQ